MKTARLLGQYGLSLLAAALLLAGCADSGTDSTQPPLDAQILESAATFLGSAAGKEVPIGIEQVVFVNSVLGINQVERKQKCLYGDLGVVLRDDYGVPILDENNCKQPIAAEPIPVLDALGNPTGEFLDFVPMEVVEYKQDESTCAVVLGYEDYVQEIVLERLNMIRSHVENPDMLARAFEEAMNNINAAESIETDPAGRLLLVSTEEIIDPETMLASSLTVKKTIDAPRENLALYYALMTEGRLAGYGVETIGDEGQVIPAPWLEIRDDLPMGDLAVLRDGTPGRDGGISLHENYADYSSDYHSTQAEYSGMEIDYVQYQLPDAYSCVYRDERSDAFARVFAGVGHEEDNIAAFARHADDTREMIRFMHLVIQDTPNDGTVPELLAHERVYDSSHADNPDVNPVDLAIMPTPIRHLQLETAASLLGAASGKEIPMTVDSIVFVNSALGINVIDTSNKGDLFGDLWVLKRDENGVPLRDENGCTLPLPFEPIVLSTIDEFGQPSEVVLETVPMMLEEYMDGIYKCVVVPGFEDYVQEVEIGRLNCVRTALTNPNMLNRHLVEAVNTLNSSVAPLKRDLSGRLVFTTSYVDALGDTQTREKAIDSPMQNLALYRALMRYGTFDGPVLVRQEGILTEVILDLRADLLDAHGLGYLKGDTENGMPGMPILPALANGYADFSGFSHASDADYAGVSTDYVQMHGEDEAGFTCKYTDETGDIHLRVLSGDMTMATGVQAFLRHAEDTRQTILFSHRVIQPSLP